MMLNRPHHIGHFPKQIPTLHLRYLMLEIGVEIEDRPVRLGIWSSQISPTVKVG